MKNAAFLLVLLLLSAGCAVPRDPPTIAPGFETLKIRQVALAPVIFRDEPIDRYYAARVARQLREESRQQLAAKGYEVVPAGEEPVLFPFRDETPGPFPLPAGADALLTIEIDHFLDAGLYDRESPQVLEIYATGILTTGEGEILWKDSGHARGSRLGAGPGGLEVFTVPAELAQSLFDTLPAMTGSRETGR